MTQSEESRPEGTSPAESSLGSGFKTVFAVRGFPAAGLLFIGFLISVICLLTVAVAIGSPAGATVNNSTLQQGDNGTAQVETSVIHHENPAETRQAHEISSVKTTLERKLAAYLNESRTRLQRGEIRAARQILGEQYRTDVARYAEIANSSDEAVVNTFRDVGSAQRKFAAGVEAFQRINQSYQRAKTRGDDQRVRELVHRIDMLLENVTQSNQSLQTNYRQLRKRTDGNYSDELATIGNLTAEIEERGREILRAEFTSTEIEVGTANRTASFHSPLSVRGRLQTANGTTIANRELTFAVGEQRIRTTSDENGSFSLVYRPTLIGTGNQTLTLRYLPSEATRYRSSTATIPISIKQVAPNLTLTATPQDGSFDDEIVVSGQIGDRNHSAAGVPIAVSFGTEAIGQYETNETGAFQFATAVPLSVKPGNRSIRAVARTRGQALASVNESTRFRVEEAQTTLSISVSPNNLTASTATETRRVSVSGRLTTANGTPIGGQTVTVRIGARTLAAVETNTQGRYNTVVEVPRASVPDGLLASETVGVRVTYAGNGTNLGSASVSESVLVSSSFQWFLLELVPWNGLVLIGGLFGTLVAVRRWYTRSNDADKATSVTSESQTSAQEAAADTEPDQLLAAAREAHSKDSPTEAVTLAYAAVRSQLERTTHIPEHATHWQVYHEYCSLQNEQLNQFEELTQLYEIAAYGHRLSKPTEATDAVSIASTLIEK